MRRRRLTSARAVVDGVAGSEATWTGVCGGDSCWVARGGAPSSWSMQLYSPLSSTSSSCVPCSTHMPRLKTAILSAWRAEAMRFVINSVVQPMMSFTDRVTWLWEHPSSPEVASSNISILVPMMSALAMASRCFCPPLSWKLWGPTTVLKPAGKLTMNSYALAFFAASTTCS
mmetsp:Transcript_87412/g.145745  ORF Transcript_87412/g.145745 Transcript_87412/m.145745 type:complete len:172 (-) Transcript_87412:195-710(-)